MPSAQPTAAETVVTQRKRRLLTLGDSVARRRPWTAPNAAPSTAPATMETASVNSALAEYSPSRAAAEAAAIPSDSAAASEAIQPGNEMRESPMVAMLAQSD